MSDSKYYTIATIAGLEKIERYYLQNKTIELSHIGFGGKAAFYLAPDSRWNVVPNEWARIALERQPKQGFVGGGATIDNMSPQYRGRFVCHAGIYDTDGDLILVASTPVAELPADESLLVSCPVDLLAILDNAEHVTIVTDTAITHPTYDEVHDLLRALCVELSKYATTEKKGLIKIATPPEVRDGVDDEKAVVPSTLKPVIDNLLQLISDSESTLNKPATTESLGLSELATKEEVDKKAGKDQVVTVATLDKPELIASLKKFTVDNIAQLKEFIYDGTPSAELDTITEICKALQDTGNAVGALFKNISEKLAITTFNEYKTFVTSQIDELKKYATTSKSGLIELAIAAEVVEGKDQLKAITPATLKPIIDNLNKQAAKSPDRLLVAEYTGSVISGGLGMNHITTVPGRLIDYKYIEADGYFVEDGGWTGQRTGWSGRIPVDTLLKYSECAICIGAWGSSTFTHKVMLKNPTATTFQSWQTGNFRIHRIYVTK